MKPMKQAELSQATSKARRWFERNRRRYTPDDVQLFDRLIPLVEKPLHVHALSEEMKRRMLPETQDRAAQPPTGRAVLAQVRARARQDRSDPSTQPTEPT